MHNTQQFVLLETPTFLLPPVALDGEHSEARSTYAETAARSCEGALGSHSIFCSKASSDLCAFALSRRSSEFSSLWIHTMMSIGVYSV